MRAIDVLVRCMAALALVIVGIDVHEYLPDHLPSLTAHVFGGLVSMWGASSLLVGWILRTGLGLIVVLLPALLSPNLTRRRGGTGGQIRRPVRCSPWRWVYRSWWSC